MPKRILFVAYGGGHISMLIPIIRSMGAEGFETPVLGLTTAAIALQRAGIPFFGYRDLAQSGDEDALETGRKLAKALDHKAKIDPEESAAYLGLSFADLARRVGAAEARARYERDGRHAFLQLSVMERALRRFRPDVVVATNSPRSEMAALLMARELEIPSVCLIDLFASQHLNPKLGEPGYGSRVCVLSQQVKQTLLDAGRREEEIVVTGNPYFDELADPELPQKAAALIRDRGWGGKKLILWARQIRAEHQAFYTQVESALIDACGRNPGWHLVIRPHPNDTIGFSGLPPTCSISGETDPLATLLAAVDVVITVTSTVGLQGVLLGKPLITVATAEVADIIPFAPYGRLGLARQIGNLGEMEQAITAALAGDAPAPVLPPLGQATQNCVTVIRSLLDPKDS